MVKTSNVQQSQPNAASPNTTESMVKTSIVHGSLPRLVGMFGRVPHSRIPATYGKPSVFGRDFRWHPIRKDLRWHPIRKDLRSSERHTIV
jgi:hypothetical protein